MPPSPIGFSSVNPHEPLLALRVADDEFALEPGRVFALGDNADCDLFVRAVDGVAMVRPADDDREVALRPGSQASLAGIDFAVVLDRGGARILPIPPSLRTKPEDAEPHVPSTPPAIPPAPGPAPVAAASPAAAGANSFVDLMAGELRRAPWFALSLLLHALVLLVAWLLFGGQKPPPEAPARYGLSIEVEALPEAVQVPFEVPVVVETQDPLEPLADPVPVEPTPAEPEPMPELAAAPSALLRVGGDRLAPRAPGHGEPAGAGGGSGGSSGDGTSLPSGASGNFRKTVSELRASGLEIVFVFDSTGSMGSSITATKEGISSMLDVLHALVPHARFSLITYRDKGAGEEYLVRTLPLGGDYYAAINFMQTIEANGGGDAPEAVLAGLLAATEQSFRKGSKRVIVLAGDAPPHPREARRTLERARQFATTPGSAVHTLMTGGTQGDAATSFERIADAGRGHCLPIADKDRLLQTVLTLAFGREFEQDLALVQRTIAKERETPPTWARDLARRGGAELLTALEKDSPSVVHALLRNPSRTVLNELITALQSQDTSPSGRNAIAYVLQQALSLPSAPVDPQKPKPIGGTEASNLRRLLRSLPE